MSLDLIMSEPCLTGAGVGKEVGGFWSEYITI